jgi:lipopolysaccharide transport system ATP-binding protein
MSYEVAIDIQNLSKSFELYASPQDRLKQVLYSKFYRSIGLRERKLFKQFLALDNISLQIKKGETFGIIGRNGSGKSTLLQIICGILNPSEGKIKVQGKVAALLELGSGFNPEFTGRENVLMGLAILGKTSEQAIDVFEDVLAFADIGQFIDQPVKTYSSGMFLRLAFAVNIISSPDIMVVDEALSVGDMAFQAKCMTALKRIQDNGTTILFVSHDMGSVKSLCQSAALLDYGRLAAVGNAPDIAERFIKKMREEMSGIRKNEQLIKSAEAPSSTEKFLNIPDQYPDEKQRSEFSAASALYRYGSNEARVDYVELINADDDKPVNSVKFNEKLRLKIYFTSYEDISVGINYYIQDEKKNLILGATTINVGEPIIDCQKSFQYIASYTFQVPLRDGNYSIQIQLVSPIVIDEVVNFLDVVDNAVVFNMQRHSQGKIWSNVYLTNEYEIKKLIC